MKNAPFQPEKLSPIPVAKHISKHAKTDSVIRGSNEFEWEESGLKKKVAVYKGLRMAQNLFRELGEDYGIEHAGFNPVIAHDTERNIGAIVVSDWVEGKKYPQFSKRTEDERLAAKDLLEKLTHYLVDKRQKGEPFLSDIGRVDQYLYNDNMRSYVLVDTDPYFDDSYEAAQWTFEDIYNWAPTVLNFEELKTWYESTSEAIKPSLEPSHA